MKEESKSRHVWGDSCMPCIDTQQRRGDITWADIAEQAWLIVFFCGGVVVQNIDHHSSTEASAQAYSRRQAHKLTPDGKQRHCPASAHLVLAKFGVTVKGQRRCLPSGVSL